MEAGGTRLDLLLGSSRLQIQFAYCRAGIFVQGVWFGKYLAGCLHRNFSIGNQILQNQVEAAGVGFETLGNLWTRNDPNSKSIQAQPGSWENRNASARVRGV